MANQAVRVPEPFRRKLKRQVSTGVRLRRALLAPLASLLS